MVIDQLVPQYAVERGDQGCTFRGFGDLVGRRSGWQAAEQLVDAAAQGVGGAMYPLVDQPGDPGCFSLISSLEPHTAQYRLMYRFGDLYRGGQRQSQQVRQLADIRKMPGRG